MDVYLMFSPTRTREYTRSPFDFDHDFFVKFTKLEAVCATPEATGAVGQRIMEDLRADCPLFGAIPYQVTTGFGIWKEYMPKAWQEAIGVRSAPLIGATTSTDTVFVVMRKRARGIWGWGDTKQYNELVVLNVYANSNDAQDFIQQTSDTFVVEQPLRGVSVRA